MRITVQPLVRDIVLLLSLPLVLIIINNNWIFTLPSPHPDPWFYLTNFRHFFEYVNTFPSNIHYFIERISWNVLGYGIYSLFPPLLANYVLHLSVYYTAVFSLYGTLSRLFHRRVGLVTALIAGAYPWFLRAVGWDYVDGFGIAQTLLIIYLFVQAAHTQSRKYAAILFFAGVILTSLITSNPFWVGFTPSIGIYYLVVNHKATRHHVIISGLWVILGIVLTMLVFAGFYHTFTGKWFFLENTFFTAQFLTQNAGNVRNILGGSYGQMVPLWHLLPILLALSSVVVLLRGGIRNVKNGWQFYLCIAGFVLAFGFLSFWHFYSTPFLNVYLYSSFAIPSWFLLLGSIIAPLVQSLTARQFRWIVGAIFVFGMTPLFLTTVVSQFETLRQNVWLLVAAVLLFFVTFVFTLSTPITLLIFAAVVSSLGFLSDDGRVYDQVFIADRQRAQSNFLAVMDTMDIVDSVYSPQDYSVFRLWYAMDENASTYFSIASTYLYPWGRTFFIRPPQAELTLPRGIQFKDGDNIIVLSSQQPTTIATQMNQVLSDVDANGVITASASVSRDNVQFSIYFVTLNQSSRVFDLAYSERFEFDQNIGLENWYAPFRGTDWSYMWSGPGTESRLQVSLPHSNREVQVQACIVATVQTETAQELELLLNDIPTVLTFTYTDQCHPLIEGTVPQELLAESRNNLTVTFRIGRTLVAHDVYGSPDYRQIGAAYDWLQFVEVSPN